MAEQPFAVDKQLERASWNGDLGLVQQLVSQGGNPNPPGGGPLLAAATFGHVEVMQYLITSGADVNTQEPKTKMTPLLAAAMRGHLKAVELLLEAGADINTRNFMGQTAVEIAYPTHMEVFGLLGAWALRNAR